MKVKMLVEFEVLDAADEDASLTENVAKSAASTAIYDYLTFCLISGVNPDTDEVTVVVDGYGECRVIIGKDHE